MPARLSAVNLGDRCHVKTYLAIAENFPGSETPQIGLVAVNLRLPRWLETPVLGNPWIVILPEVAFPQLCDLRGSRQDHGPSADQARRKADLGFDDAAG